jgi:hypothetical protein
MRLSALYRTAQLTNDDQKLFKLRVHHDLY